MIIRYIFSLAFILCLTNFQVIAIVAGSSDIRKDDSIQMKSELTTAFLPNEKLNYTVTRNMQNNLSGVSVRSITQTAHNSSSVINFVSFSAMENLFHYQTNSTWPNHNVTGNLNLEINGSTLKFSNSNATIMQFTQKLNIEFDMVDDFLSFSFKSVNFDFNDNEQAFVLFKFGFWTNTTDVFAIKYYFVASDVHKRFNEMYENLSSDINYYLNPGDKVQFSGDDIQNIEILPSSIFLQSLEILAFKSSGGTLNLEIDSFGVFKKVANPFSILQANYLTNNKSTPHFINLPANQKLQINVTKQFTITYNATQIFSEVFYLEGDVNIEPEGVYFFSINTIKLIDYYSSDQFTFPIFTRNLSLTINGKIQTDLRVERSKSAGEYMSFEIKGYLLKQIIETGKVLFHSEEVVELNYWNISQLVGFTVANKRFLVSVKPLINFTIPLDLHSGSVDIVGYNHSGYSFIFKYSLVTEPLQVMPQAKQIFIDPFINSHIHFSAKNFINSTEVLITNINWDVNIPFHLVNSSIYIPALSFESGDYLVNITFFAEGYSPVQEQIVITVAKPNFPWELNYEGYNYPWINLQIIIPNFYQYDVSIDAKIVADKVLRLSEIGKSESLLVSGAKVDTIEILLIIDNYNFLKIIDVNGVSYSSSTLVSTITNTTNFNQSVSNSILVISGIVIIVVVSFAYSLYFIKKRRKQGPTF